MRIAIVDGFSTARFLARELVRRGVECIHVRSRRPSADSVERTFDPSPYVLDLPFTDDVAALADRLALLEVRRVVAGTDIGVEVADLLGTRLGLPANDPRTSAARRDKYAMVEALRRAGIRSIRSGPVIRADDAVAWFAQLGGRPVVVKPTTSGGTDNVRVCRSETEVRSACTAILGKVNLFGFVNRAAIIQEHLSGVEYIVNSVAVDGAVKISDVWRSNKTPGPLGAPLYDYQDPQDLGAADVEGMMEYVREATSALGIRHGAAHSEVMMTSDGPVLIETGARLMGSTFPYLSLECSGVSHVHLLASALCGGSEFERFRESDVRWRTKLRYVWLNNRNPGYGTPHQWRDHYQGLVTFRDVLLQRDPSQFMPLTVDVATSPGFVCLVGAGDAVERDHAAIRAFEDSRSAYSTGSSRV